LSFNKRIVVLVTEGEYEQLREDAYKARKSMTALLRDAYFGDPRTRFIETATGRVVGSSSPDRLQALKDIGMVRTADEVVTRCTCPPKRFPVQHRAKIQATVCAAHEATCPMFDEFAGE
jgi:hypothetical protein